MKICSTCKPEPHKAIPVDDVKHPVCPDCGQELGQIKTNKTDELIEEKIIEVSKKFTAFENVYADKTELIDYFRQSLKEVAAAERARIGNDLYMELWHEKDCVCFNNMELTEEQENEQCDCMKSKALSLTPQKEEESNE